MKPGPDGAPLRDSQFDSIDFIPSEIRHAYGERVHVLGDPFLLTHLARLCSPEATQPLVNELITTIYRGLIQIAINREFPLRRASMRTRMAEFHPEAVYSGPIVDPDVRVVSVNLARAGTLPSHVCYTALNYLMNPAHVRQDHISIARQTGADQKVTGSAVSGHKIGGPIDDAIVLFPDPMGATGSTLVEAMDLFASYGTPRRIIALHCIVTPEYLKRVLPAHPALVVYTVRLDRGLSDREVLASVPGTHWDRERGLNQKQYIVPGGGGIGEILNNAFV